MIKSNLYGYEVFTEKQDVPCDDEQLSLVTKFCLRTDQPLWILFLEYRFI